MQEQQKKAFLKRTADVPEKLAIAGIALGIFQNRTNGVWISGLFLALSYLFTYLESKK